MMMDTNTVVAIVGTFAALILAVSVIHCTASLEMYVVGTAVAGAIRTFVVGLCWA